MKAWRFSKFTDQQLAQLLGALNNGADSTTQKLLTEVSYRLVRNGGGPLTHPEEIEMYGGIMDFQSRQREIRRGQRRKANQRRERFEVVPRKPVQMSKVLVSFPG